MRRRRAVILPVVLFVLVLLGLLVALFAFRVNADLAATQAVAYRLQARLAAEAGVDAVKLLLRLDRYDVNRWFNNPEELHRIIVWSPETDSTIWGTNDELGDGAVAYRFSIVADDSTDDEKYIRFGITDASASVNLNEATEDQLLILMQEVAGGDEEIDPHLIVNAILDWRDQDAVPRGEAADAEGEYYRTLDQPYRIKNGPFDTVEELLLVKGVTARILFGEDIDRNGLLSPNEDDGDETFPPDNSDGVLNRGLYPYLTVLSAEDDVSIDNRPRIYLFGEENVVREQLTKVFEDEPSLVDYIVEVTRAQGQQGSGGDGAGKGKAAPQGQQPGGDGSADTEGAEKAAKDALRQQRRDGDSEEDEVPPEDAASADEPPDDAEEGEVEDEQEPPEDEDADPEEDEESDDAASGTAPIRSPASLLIPRSIRGEIREGPLGPEHLAVLLDRTTTIPPDQSPTRGLININTAPPLVLRCIDGLTEEKIKAIVDLRGALDSQTKATPAWLVTEQVVDLETFDKIAPQITARGQQFTVESLGYADHIGMVVRLQVVLDMMGPIAQTIYYRDLTHLGGQYPIRQEDEENIRVR